MLPDKPLVPNRRALQLVLSAWAICICGTAGSAAPHSPPELSAQLEEMGTADQAVRSKLGPCLKSGHLQTKECRNVTEEMAVVDARNLSKLETIVELYGWPDMRVVGVHASNSAFLILQHSPLSAQQRLLPTFRQAVSSGKGRVQDLAMLEDRVRLGEGKKQLYGTQITAGPDGKPRISPIEDPHNLDVRRKAVGLPPMSIYIERAEADIGQAIDKSALHQP